MLHFLGYLAVAYVSGFVVGTPLGLLLSILFARSLARVSKRINELVPANGSPLTPNVVERMHLRWSSRALVAVGSATGCGIGAAAYIGLLDYHPGGFIQFAFLLCAISFWKFKVLLAVPAVAGFWLGLQLFGT